MPPTTAPLLINFEVTNGRTGQYVKVTNVTRGGTLTAQLDSNKRVIINASKEGQTSWANGDIIVGSIAGEINENNQQTISGKSVSFKLTSTATSTMASISL